MKDKRSLSRFIYLFYLFIFLHVCSLPNTICSKDFLLHLIAFATLCQKAIDYICVYLFLSSPFCSIDLFVYSFTNTIHFDYCILIVNLEIGWWQSSDSVLFLQYCIGYSGSLAFCVNFRISLSVFRKYLARI